MIRNTIELAKYRGHHPRPKRLKDFSDPRLYSQYVDEQLAALRNGGHHATADRYMKELSAESILNLATWIDHKEIDPSFALEAIRGHLAYLLGNTERDKKLISALGESAP
jgi:hypothetical protein